MTDGAPRHAMCRGVRPAVAALCVSLFAGPAVAQTLGRGTDDGISMWRVVAVLLLCLALAVFAAFALRAKMGGGRPFLAFGAIAAGRRLRLKETLRLGHQIDLCIVECDGQELLVASSPAGAQLLRELPAAEGLPVPGDPRA